MSDAFRGDDDFAEWEAIIERDSDTSDLEAQRRVADALLQKGAGLRAEGRREEALASFDQLVDRFAGEQDHEVRRQVVRALHYKGYVLQSLDRSDDATDAFQQAVTLGGPLAQPTEEVMSQLYDEALALADEGRHAEALSVLADLLNPWPDGPPEEAVDIAVAAMLRAAEYASQVGASAEAMLQMYDELIRRYGDRADADVRWNVAVAMFEKAKVLGDTERVDAAIETCTEALAYVGEAEGSSFDALIVAGLNCPPNPLAFPGRDEAAEADFRAVLDRYAEGESAEIDRHISFARDRLN